MSFKFIRPKSASSAYILGNVGSLHAASNLPYTRPSSTDVLHEVSESEHLGLSDGLRLNRDLQQSDDENDEHNELLHL